MSHILAFYDEYDLVLPVTCKPKSNFYLCFVMFKKCFIQNMFTNMSKKRPQNHTQKGTKTSLLEVFLGTRGHPGSVSARWTLIPLIFYPKMSILSPRGDPKIAHVIIFSVKISVFFDYFPEPNSNVFFFNF